MCLTQMFALCKCNNKQSMPWIDMDYNIKNSFSTVNEFLWKNYQLYIDH